MTKLNEKRDEFDHPCKQACSGWQQGYAAGFQDALAELMPQVQKLVGAYKKYAMHVDVCSYNCADPNYACDCGLHATLTEWQEYVREK